MSAAKFGSAHPFLPLQNAKEINSCNGQCVGVKRLTAELDMMSRELEVLRIWNDEMKVRYERLAETTNELRRVKKEAYDVIRCLSSDVQDNKKHITQQTGIISRFMTCKFL